MHKLLKRLNRFIFCVFSLCAVSCGSLKTAVKPIDYDSSTAVLYEVSLGEKSLAKEPLTALSKALVLKSKTAGYAEVSALYDKAVAASRKNFDEAVAAKNWDKALLYFYSLANAGLAPAGWTETSLQESQADGWRRNGDTVLVASRKTSKTDNSEIKPSSAVIEKMIRGTVTVWVDRGMNIEKGVAFADRVIGSGFFIDKRGYFLTNYHVIQSEVDPTYEGYSRVYVKDPNNSALRIPAKVIGWDSILDVALLKTELTPEVTFNFGSSGDLTIGSRIYAIGSPAGLEKTLTSGIVSAKNRRFLSLGSVLQIDAAINHGNSGGPLIDEYGNAQAIVFAGLERNEGLNFAIPIELVKAVLPALFAGGEVKHSWFGSFGHTIASGEKDLIESGISVDYILPLSPAYGAGINEGDIIQKINGATVKTLEDIQDYIFSIPVKTIVRAEGLTLVDGKYVSAVWFVQLDGRPEFPGRTAYETDVMSRVMLPLTGMKLARVARNSYRILDTIKGSPADETGFSENDYVELKGEQLNKNNEILYIQVYAKRRKAGYLEGFMGLYAYLDDPSYF